MKLMRVHIIRADTCAGLLDGFDLNFRGDEANSGSFEPFCLIGPNGAGKSQFLQILVEIFQSVIHAIAKDEERVEGNPDLQFELEYLLSPCGHVSQNHVRITRKVQGKSKPKLLIQIKQAGEWVDCDLSADATRALLPTKIVGYTSGGNETLSLPFLLSRGGYASDVSEAAINSEGDEREIPDTRLMLIDYGTHIEVLVANLLLGDYKQQEALLKDARLKSLHSFRCTIQLAHSAVPKGPKNSKNVNKRKGIQLTSELERSIDQLKRCSTSYEYQEKTETYTFDFLVNEQSRIAFGTFWNDTLELYSALHKLAMLNDLAIPKKTRERFRKEIKTRRFASRLPEPQDEDKVFQFDRVRFTANSGDNIVDYVSLSDGEHQLTQLLGTFCMLSYPNVLFLLDEPESHFNPQWRVKFLSKLLSLPTPNGKRDVESKASRQECLITTHAPFVPSDMVRDKVLIFGKSSSSSEVDGNKTHIEVRRPSIETFGTTFDEILEECFDVTPPISGVPLNDINELMKSQDPEKVRTGVEKLGNSVEKMLLADHLRQLLVQEK
jgi:restriction system-associated AAA family ATPase